VRPLLTRTLLFLAVAAIATACAGKKGDFRSPYPADERLVLAEGSLAELYGVLKARTPEHGVFWSSGRVAIRQEGVDGTVWFDATVIYDEPDAIRLRGGRFVTGTLFEVIVCGDNAWVHLNKERELYEGTLAELRRQGGILGSMSLADMTAGILVHRDLRRRLEEKREWEVLAGREELFVTTELQAGRKMTWRIRRADGLVREAVVRGPGGAVELQAVYEGFELTEEFEPLPTRMNLYVQQDAMSVRYKADGYKPNSDVKPENVCYLPRGTRVFPLAALMERDAPIQPETEEPEN
jgi:hypothetical protein